MTFESFELDNGLRLIVNTDEKTPLVAVNMLYTVGAKDESEDATGFAHLFEHLMFSGSRHFESYDKALQTMGGESNAFTNNDYTNYYLTLPADFLSYALDLEADRMHLLNINQRSLDVQRSVVVEEFKQRYLNRPYGDLWAEIRSLAFKKHPYRWQTIGMDISHVENASLQQVEDFYQRFYHPANAILSISGNVSADKALREVERAFGTIAAKEKAVSSYPQEPEQKENRTKTVLRDVPSNLICIIFPMSSRTAADFYTQDLLSDVLSNGKSSRMYTRLVVQQGLFTEINAFVSGDDDAGLFIVMGKYRDGVEISKGEEAIWQELKAVCENPITEAELQKMKNKNEATATFSNIKVLDKAMNLAYYAHLGDADLINRERALYNEVTIGDLQSAARQMFLHKSHSTLYYLKNDENENK